MSIPTKGERYASLMEHLRLAEEDAAMLQHLYRDESRNMAMGWFAIAELMKRAREQITKLATRGLQ